MGSGTNYIKFIDQKLGLFAFFATVILLPLSDSGGQPAPQPLTAEQLAERVNCCSIVNATGESECGIQAGFELPGGPACIAYAADMFSPNVEPWKSAGFFDGPDAAGIYTVNVANEVHLQALSAAAIQCCNPMGNGTVGLPEPTPQVAPPNIAWNTQLADYHDCGNNTPGVDGDPGTPSPMSSELLGPDDSTRFERAMHKRLNCCLATTTQASGFQEPMGYWPVTGAPPARLFNGSAGEKFDCIDNSNENLYPDFDSLWSSTTGTADNQLPNAIFLRNSVGQPITGFYRMDGTRCDGFGEASNQPILRGRVNPLVTQGLTMDKVVGATGSGDNAPGSVNFTDADFTPIPVPINGEWTNLTNGPRAPLRGPPDCQNNPIACLTCPILARAAMISKCPPLNSDPITPRYTFEDNFRRCAMAKSIMIHVRVEQIYEIAGQRTIPPSDTMIEAGRAPLIDVSKMIRR